MCDYAADWAIVVYIAEPISLFGEEKKAGLYETTQGNDVIVCFEVSPNQRN